MDRIAGFIVLAFQRCSDRVREAARCHVGRRDDIGRLGGDRRAGLYVLEGALRKRHARDLGEGDRDFLVVDILDGDRERDRLAFGVGCIVRLAVVLGHDQARINLIVRDRQSTFRLVEVIVVLVGAFVEGDGERVRARTDQRLTAGERICGAFARDPAGLGGKTVFVLAIDICVGQCRAVIYLRSVAARQRKIALGNLLIAVNVDEGDRREVRVMILEVVSGQTHLGLAVGVSTFDHMRTVRGSGLACHKAEVVLRIQCRVNAVDLDAVDRVAGGRVGSAVIGGAAGIAV